MTIEAVDTRARGLRNRREACKRLLQGMIDDLDEMPDEEFDTDNRVEVHTGGKHLVVILAMGRDGFQQALLDGVEVRRRSLGLPPSGLILEHKPAVPVIEG